MQVPRRCPKMKTHPCTRIIAALCGAFLASCAPPPQETTRMPVSASFRPDSSESGRLFQEINSYRRSQGKTNLQRHTGLDRLAQAHSEYLRKHRGTFSLQGRNVSHFGFEGRALMARERFQMANVSENVAATSKVGGSSSQRFLSLWKGSKDHHKNLLDDWTHSGIGVVVDSDGMVFATQLFSTVNSSQMTMRERFNRF
jgi:uncharacterized protein YkwD